MSQSVTCPISHLVGLSQSSLSQSFSQPVGQSVSHSFSQSFGQSAKISQLARQSIRKSVSQWASSQCWSTQTVNWSCTVSHSVTRSKFIHFKDLKIILLFVLIQFLCDYHLFNLELNLRQGEEVLIIGIKSGGLWLPVSKIVLLKVLLPWLYTVKITDS